MKKLLITTLIIITSILGLDVKAAGTELYSTSLYTTANLVAYYRLEDATDSKGSRNLTNNNSVSFSAAKFNNGANFGTSNTNKYLSYSTDNGGIDGGAMSISLWVKLSTEVVNNGAAYNFVQQGSSVSKVIYQIGYEEAGGVFYLYFQRVKTGVANPAVKKTVAGGLGTSNWHHLVITYDGTNITGYLDGTSAGQTPTTGNGSFATKNGFYIGANYDQDRFVNGLIDDVAFFSYALTSTEVTTLYQDPPAAATSQESDIIIFEE